MSSFGHRVQPEVISSVKLGMSIGYWVGAGVGILVGFGIGLLLG